MRRGAVNRDALGRLQKSLAHRGPDNQGVVLENNVGLVHTRLSIIDLAGGDQPLHMPEQNVSLIVNGEIYNYVDLRADAEKHGYDFSTHSDCEVILPLYKKHGESCVDHLRGMFAFCLLDRNSDKLLFARDRMGEKPLYYFMDEEKFIFSSELHSILASGLVPKVLNYHAIGRYFRYQYVPEPETPFRDVFKLDAASVMSLDMRAWEMEINRYWNAFDVEPIVGEPTACLRAAVEDAVSTSLVSDVPIGLSLSGGIDSSLLACLMRKNTDRPLNAISIGYVDASIVDERPQARELASRLGMDFHDVEIVDDEMIERFPEMVNKRDDLIGDISGFNYFKIMEYAREQGIPVMLQGHGVDELCWGYPWVKDSVARNESVLHRGAANHDAAASWRSIRQLLRKMAGRKASERRFQFYELQPYTAWVLKNAGDIFTQEFLDRSGFSASDEHLEYGELNMRVDLETTRLITDFYLRENGIAQGDRLSMANSVEMRLPFVDYKLVETIIGLRKASRDDHLPLKQLLKDSVRDLLPDEVLNRPKKGFSPPMQRWQQELRRNYGELLLDGCLVDHEILSKKACEEMAAVSIRDNAKATVSRMVVTLELWLRGIL